MAAVSKISQAFLAFLPHGDAGGPLGDLSKGNMYRELTSRTNLVAICFIENLMSLKIIVFFLCYKAIFWAKLFKMVGVYLNSHPSLNRLYLSN